MMGDIKRGALEKFQNDTLWVGGIATRDIMGGTREANKRLCKGGRITIKDLM